MAVDTEYLDELMKSIEPAIYPDGVPGEENEDEVEEEVFGEGEEFADEYEMELASIPEKPSANQPTESEIQVESALAAVEEQEVALDEPSLEETAETVETVVDNGDESGEVGWDEISSSSSVEEPAEALEEIELDMNMSEEEIDAMLNAAKSSAEEEKTPISDSDDVADLLSLFGDDSDISDIKETLDKADNNIALDQSALDEPEITIPDLDEEEPATEGEDNKKEKKKKEKKPKAKKDKSSKESAEGEEKAAKEKKPGLFSKLFGALTEEVPEEEPVVPEASETGVTDENAQILSELDAEDKGKKKKKKKKKDKGSKEQPETEGSERDIREKEDDEEAPDQKKKKPKKEKKKKEPKPEDTTPTKKLPRKRVRVTFLFAFTIMAGLLILCYFVTDYITKKQARFAYDNAQYEVAYSDLYGMDLNEEDEEIFIKSKTIMILQRKVDSYENYMQLGMKAEALNALLEGYDLYPSVMESAEKYGVVSQVKSSYDKIIDYLGSFGLSAMDAEEINGYTSSVMYNKRILSIVNNTPFEYGYSSGEEVDETAGGAATEDIRTVEDILPEEEDFLPDNPEEIFEE